VRQVARGERTWQQSVSNVQNTYALAVIHDEDSNGKLNTNWLGIPTEGYGFSNDARALLGPPTFSAASFSYDGRSVELTISLHC
jgi:uncharacterized protein (DUF2141 family)